VDPRVSGVIAASPFSDLPTVVRERSRWFWLPGPYVEAALRRAPPRRGRLQDASRSLAAHRGGASVPDPSGRPPDDVVLKDPKDPATLDLVLSDTYCHKTYSIGLVDAAGKVNFYEGEGVGIVEAPRGLRRTSLCRERSRWSCSRPATRGRSSRR
jgi:hypothetical protein